MKIHRRKFVKLLGKGIPGLLLLNTLQTRSATAEDKEVIYRTLGNTGIRVPIVSSGIIPVDNKRLCRAIFRSGITFFDSAYVYTNGRNSAVLGEMLDEFGRENFTIATKVLLPFDPETHLYDEATLEQEFFSQLDTELERLGTSYIDILYTHKPANRANVINPKVLACFEKAKKEGKIKFIGTSNHGNQAECIDAMIEAGVYDVAYIATNYQQLPEVAPAIDRAAAAGIGVVAMKVHAGGFLDKEQTLPVNKVAAAKWVLNNPNVATATLTFRSYEDMEMQLPLMTDITMTNQERDDLKEFSHRSEFASLFCHGCNECVAQCPQKLPIPDAMRAYMYAYGYNDSKKALETLSKLQINTADCGNCTSCSVQCKHNFNVHERLADMCRVKETNNPSFA